MVSCSTHGPSRAARGSGTGCTGPRATGSRPARSACSWPRRGPRAIPSDRRARSPYWGYYFRILTAQGKDAPGGAYDYLAQGRLIGGFALVAFPARYGVSGIMTFIVNHDGVVYQKDLGPNTAAIARAMKEFNPDNTWKRS